MRSISAVMHWNVVARPSEGLPIPGRLAVSSSNCAIQRRTALCTNFMLRHTWPTLRLCSQSCEPLAAWAPHQTPGGSLFLGDVLFVLWGNGCMSSRKSLTTAYTGYTGHRRCIAGHAVPHPRHQRGPAPWTSRVCTNVDQKSLWPNLRSHAYRKGAFRRPGCVVRLA